MYWFIPELFDLIKAAMWPAVVLVIFYFLKDPLSIIIKNIKLIQHNGTSVHISQSLESIQNKINNLSLSEEKDTDGVEVKYAESETQEIIEQYPEAILDPKIIVIESWNSLENTLKSRYEKIYGINEGIKKHNPSIMEKFLQKDGRFLHLLMINKVITKQMFDVINDLKLVKDRIIQIENDDIDLDDAKLFCNGV